MQVQRGSQSSERECSPVATNEIPQLETGHLGIAGNNNNRGNRILPGSFHAGASSFNSGPGPLGGILPGGDPGGWVSLAALSRTQVGTRINTVYTPGSGIGTTQQNFNPVLRLPSSGSRRPVEPNIFDQGYQFNTVIVPSRPFFSSNSCHLL